MSAKSRVIAVTGGAGYVGAALVPKLLAAGYGVRVVDLFLFGDDVLPRHPALECVAAIEDDDPVIYIEHRFLHEDDADVPTEYFTTPLGRAAVLRQGTDVTLVAVGPMVAEAIKAAAALEASGISAEVIDVRTLRPLDTDTILASVAKTGRLVVADSDWGPCGVAGEVIARVAEQCFDALKASPRRVTWPDSAVPSSQAIEPLFYPGAPEILAAAVAACEKQDRGPGVAGIVKPFEGPF